MSTVHAQLAAHLVEEADDLATRLTAAGLVVVHDAESGGEHNVAELAGREEGVGPLLHVGNARVEARGNDTALVDAASKLHHDLARAVVVHDGELPDVAVLLHVLQELDDDLGARAHHDLALAALLRVGDGLKSVREGGHAHHLWVGG
eukprot:CAMPEP_0118852192 /NCGR_PEP_ID=MMETSP1163-20130328/1312_1 /TAXON_ID=124430 /ORGANISM="Phaeomonas parva, Strain CCMP2877" /LENGTH=147 /DNA_ID=CAMNT_0006784601 /DNA_START=27 /DNA_END=470 /DNA_ORIENTATION=-